MRLFSFVLSVVLVVIWMLTGCHDPVMAPGTAQIDPLYQSGHGKVLALEELHRFVAASEPIVEAGSERPMMVTVPIRLLADEQINVQYRFDFFVRKGVPVAPEMSWAFMALPARARVYMQGASLDTTATDWRLQLRPAR